MNKKKLFSLSKVLTNIFGLTLGVITVGRVIALENSTAINSFLGAKTYVVVNENGEPVEVEYFSSDFNSVKEVKENAKTVAKRVTDEGITLLRNNNALPLSAGASINAYSVTSADLVYSGTGSSGASTTSCITLKEACEQSGLTLNQDLYSFYKTAAENKTYGRGASSGIGASFKVQEAPWDKLPESKNDAADVGLFIVGRNGGEGKDLDITTGSKDDLRNGNYLLLTNEERDVLSHMKQLKEEGKLSKIVVFINSANTIQCDFEDEFAVDALLWAPTLGETGALSFTDILAGKVNPSGKTVDTFFKANHLNPVYANFGDYTYAGTKVSDFLMSNKYVVYQEGIYNGYRYTETRYEDKVLNRANTGEFNYRDVVSYPFGYGLSYSSFEYSDFQVEDKGDNYQLSLTVKNVADVAGKEAVEFYLQKPYTQYDIDNGIEKASVELVEFAKTKVLEKNESQTVTVDVKKSELASYDANNAMTYILDAGDYYFTAAKDAHEATNNILAMKNKTISDGMTNAGNKSLASKITVADFDDVSYSLSDTTDKEITNQFDDCDINKYQYAESNSVTYVSRNNWASTTKFGYDASGNNLNNQVRLTGNSDMASDADYYNYRGMEDDERMEFPTYSSTETSYSLVDMIKDSEGKDIPYDDPKWDALLDQLSLDEQATLLSSGLRSTGALSSINKPVTIDHNGATGPMMNYNVSKSNNRGLAVSKNDPDQDETPIAYPANSMASATYNKELIHEYGKTWGEDCLWAGYSGLYGPAVNIHRGVYGGRAFEYYSEDPLLSGKIVSEVIKGLSEKGVYSYLKHCFLNDQETNREGVNTWANEQTIREIYLKPFEIAIEEGKCAAVMTGFNRLGTIWTGAHGFIKNVLRGEFGMTGIAVSDFFHKEYMNLSAGIYNGNDLPDGQADKDTLYSDADTYAGLAWEMRDATHRLLYMVAHSNAMNGLAEGVTIIDITPTWIILLNTIEIAMIVLTVLSVAGLVVSVVLLKKDNNL
ncbi:MAG: glycoside hydrolase family 3 C-terminal domain-containing protein [Bacilli bacterium]|nr:glycoside hydrolase family 3 C-terminal domain-containing protein [Bacilli bacterium]